MEKSTDDVAQSAGSGLAGNGRGTAGPIGGLMWC